MKTSIAGLALAAALGVVPFAAGADPPKTPDLPQAKAPELAPVTSTETLKIGDPAPDFTLPDQNFKPVTLSRFKGNSNVVLAFYVLAFTAG